MKSSYYLYGKVKKSWAGINVVLEDKISESEVLIRLLQKMPLISPRVNHIMYNHPVTKKWFCPERDWVRINKSLDAQKHCRDLIKEPKG